MKLRDTWFVRILACSVAGLGILGAVLEMWVKARSGHWLDVYETPSLVPSYYGSDFVTLLVLVAIGVVLSVAWIIRWVRARSLALQNKGADGQEQGS